MTTTDATRVPADPLAGMTLRRFGARLRAGAITAEQATAAYLARIAALDPRFGAFRARDAERALGAARGIDALLQAGTDLGPLMGVPVAVKEIFATDGWPYGAGTDLDLADITPPQGPFMRSLKQAGCIVLGTTRTTEFAISTINVTKPMPWNPADPAVQRVCGGSSHGSAAALAAGLCGFSVGSDTGGSVRLPAALCGTFGYKSTAGLLATEGVFPLTPTLDSVGVFTRFADDAALILAAVRQAAEADGVRPRALRLACPGGYFRDDLDPPVRAAFEAALAALRGAEVEIVDIEVPGLDEAMAVFTRLLPGEFVAHMGRARLSAAQDSIDPVAWARIGVTLGIEAEELATLQASQRRIAAAVQRSMADCDAWITPTTPVSPGPVAQVRELDAALAWNRRAGRNTRPGNFFIQCGCSIPIQAAGALPVGLQLTGRSGDDARLLAIAKTVETICGTAR